MPLAVTAGRRSPLPQVPTMAEAGVANMESQSWFGLAGPRRRAEGVAERLSGDVAKVLQSPDVLEKLAKMGRNRCPWRRPSSASFVKAEMEASRRFTSGLGIMPPARPTCRRPR